MSLYKIEYLRTRGRFVFGCVLLFIMLLLLCIAIMSSEEFGRNISDAVDSYTPQILLVMQFPYIVVVIALGLTGRGTTRGWRKTDLSMPLGRVSYARENLGYAIRLYFIGLIAVALVLITFWYMGKASGGYHVSINRWDHGVMLYRSIYVELIVGIVYSLFIFGLLAPCLVTGYYRGSWGWWAFIILYLPLICVLPYLVVSAIAHLGGPLNYWLPFMALGPVVAAWGWLNTVWHFKQKPDY